MKMRSRADILNSFILEWYKVETKQNVGISIVEAVVACGLTTTLADLDITFSASGHVEKDSHANTQKIQRYLGMNTDSNINRGNLLELETPIVKAMPQCLRIQYLNECYSICDVQIAPSCKSADNIVDLNLILQSMIKEDAETYVALISITQGDTTMKTLKHFKTELQESIGIKTAALKTVDEKLEKITASVG